MEHLPRNIFGEDPDPLNNLEIWHLFSTFLLISQGNMKLIFMEKSGMFLILLEIFPDFFDVFR